MRVDYVVDLCWPVLICIVLCWYVWFGVEFCIDFVSFFLFFGLSFAVSLFLLISVHVVLFFVDWCWLSCMLMYLQICLFFFVCVLCCFVLWISVDLNAYYMFSTICIDSYLAFTWLVQFLLPFVGLFDARRVCFYFCQSAFSIYACLLICVVLYWLGKPFTSSWADKGPELTKKTKTH